jgi:NADPH:quinone reductase-like Zn-dependent oxidoreductase
MKAVVMARRSGGIGALEMRDVPVPVPKPGELLVRVHAASVNDWDWGLLDDAPTALEKFFARLVSPKVDILGCDIAGRVDAVAGDVTGFAPGDEVYADTSGHRFGGFAEYVCVPAASVARKPAGMSFEQAAATPQAAMLAWQGLIDAGRLQRGMQVLINGAGGGVGTFAVQIARLHDAQLTAVDKSSKLDMLRGLGVQHVIDYTRQDFTQGGQRYDLILDVKTNRPLSAYQRVLTARGRYVTVGGDMLRLLNVALFSRGRAHVVALKPNKDLARINELFEAGRLRPVIDSTYALPATADAFRRFASGDHHGKIVVRAG